MERTTSTEAWGLLTAWGCGRAVSSLVFLNSVWKTWREMRIEKWKNHEGCVLHFTINMQVVTPKFWGVERNS